MKSLTKKSSSSGPSSSIGIMRFMESSNVSPRLSPWFIVIVSLVIAVAFVLIHMFFPAL